MSSTITKTLSPQCTGEAAPELFDDWFDPIETAVQERAREFIQALIRGELDAALAQGRRREFSSNALQLVPYELRGHCRRH